MKNFVALIILGFSSLSFADFKCNKSVDPKKVVLFVDTNNSPKEIEGAAKAACERGETFRKFPNKKPADLEKLQYWEKEELVQQKSLQKEIAALAVQNIALSSMIVSGHDGGGSVHGSYGGVDKYQIIESLKNAYKGKDNLLKEMKSVYMWGCWSMGPSEVGIWKKELPHLKLTAGFMDMGPLNTTEASHSVLNGLLVKEKALVAEADAKKLKRAIQGIPNINVTLASVYTDAACGDMMYYQTQGDSDDNRGSGGENSLFTSGTHFVDFDENFSCKGMAKQIEKNRKVLIKYFYGEKPLPEDKPGSEIREIYSFLRHTAKCHSDNHVMNADRIFLLRFYEQVKENFGMRFHSEIGAANKEYVALNDLLKKSGNSDEKKAFQAYLKQNGSKYFNPRFENLKGKSRKEILSMISYLDGMVKQPFAKEHPKNFAALKTMRNAMDNYLFQLNPKCMDFMRWHEVYQGNIPDTKCPI